MGKKDSFDAELTLKGINLSASLLKETDLLSRLKNLNPDYKRLPEFEGETVIGFRCQKTSDFINLINLWLLMPRNVTFAIYKTDCTSVDLEHLSKIGLSAFSSGEEFEDYLSSCVEEGKNVIRSVYGKRSRKTEDRA